MDETINLPEDGDIIEKILHGSEKEKRVCQFCGNFEDSAVRVSAKNFKTIYICGSCEDNRPIKNGYRNWIKKGQQYTL